MDTRSAIDAMITVHELKDDKVLDGFAIFGHEDGIVVKLMDERSPNIKVFDFEAVEEGGDEEKDGSNELLEKEGSCQLGGVL